MPIFAALGSFVSSMFSGVGITDIIKFFFRIGFFTALIGLSQTFINFIISKIPQLELSGCAGYYAMQWGFIDGFRLMVSIVVYGFVVKFAFSLYSKSFN